MSSLERGAAAPSDQQRSSDVHPEKPLRAHRNQNAWYKQICQRYHYHVRVQVARSNLRVLRGHATIIFFEM